ncbi:MAG: purine-nucleoside phosphorylase [Candidatus Marinimicrobia bacterium]|jgi:purine-nucleoside phosphorylase|nr:purine-nucleoside phosphorylase [Candidatus Neomarinimicrobiota bacterium]|tara:strand:- start:18683 stop:19471 length:789 start_codon:yes stop_codon:yes gene_type:complete
MINIDLMAEQVFDQSGFGGRIAVVLGSGLGGFADGLSDQKIIPYENIPDYPRATVEGHSGELVAGSLDGVEVLAAKGRFHYYEGYEFDEITIPVRLFSKLGIDHLIITNSSGSMNKDCPPGTLMAIMGHMDCTYRHSAADPKLFTGSPYHNPILIEVAQSCASDLELELATGNYCWTLGPSYETPAEIEDMQRLGGDVVGMSTVPEIITAGELGMKVLTISCLTNYAAGISPKLLTHEEVIDTAKKAGEKFTSLLKRIISEV